MNKISSNKTILKNTLMLYIRQILSLGVSLYTVRVVLDVLGAEDYGIYSVIGGIVMFFSFLKGSMSSATQRFFSFAIGENDELKLNQIFSVNLLIYFLIAVFSLILLEVIGFWFVKEYLKLPEIRIDAALNIYHFSVFTFFVTIFSTPFTSAIIAHEDMHIYAYLSIIDVLMKLGVVFLLVVLEGDKLILYSQLLFTVSVVLFVVYGWICTRRYQECQISKFYWNKKIFSEIIGFTGWTLFGQFTSAARNQAVVVLVNQFYNPVVVASTVVARNISTQIQMFSNNFNSSLYPPIIKSYASDNKVNMFALIHSGSKITFFLMWIFALPFLLEMDVILGLWLKTIPEGTILFTRLALIEVLVNSISLPIQTAARAPGRMKVYELVLGFIQILIFLASWLFFYLGYYAYIIFVVAIVANAIMFFVRLLIVKYLVDLSIQEFLSKVFYPVGLVVLVTTLVSCTYKYLICQTNDVPQSLLAILVYVICILLSVYFIGLDKEWRVKLKNMIVQKIKFN
ncbi:MATE family efflux transporter [Wenyingzhuangia sp. chi5]|uniref:MATE family efflux transporter n=1 Tax=Wenyingzhuangia gilva TaxID=3057677 RepID=A0ABT8VNV6_9FLAO|nr:MATE family efflux transporter [Wenyingzhuangia sp. chi5]MDO3693637.1 MATE family efflux transporter [Wenyingzhuangia sp. chi5]